ncbi:hypothetical protein [Limnoglobus roseus]|uniref:Uncharacterized protein n=1 Tax=Limnoglobus roseus TaxID=2598579 RepID=A0A5C1ANY3_9BACT|nr:hypothetical protein [Limnoglobus roseus]QEL20881.1 hypothetical protein PX52LOC_08002 [Limnoglobus roseus]
MAAWHRRYNVSGTVHVGESVENWCRLLRQVLQTDDVAIIGHYSGAVSVFAFSPVADVVSCGHKDHDFWALVPGERSDWQQFAVTLAASLNAAGLPRSLVVHDGVLLLE